MYAMSGNNWLGLKVPLFLHGRAQEGLTCLGCCGKPAERLVRGSEALPCASIWAVSSDARLHTTRPNSQSIANPQGA